MSTRIVLGIEYNGHSYAGWQRQNHSPSIQATLEAVLSQIANHSIQTFCAGRTDAGVHAIQQIVHFDTTANRPLSAWVKGSNTYLPKNISIQWAQPVPPVFHARFSALSRSYRYVIYNQAIHSAFIADRTTWYPFLLNEHAMHEAAQCLVGEHDFSSFRSSQCESLSPMRCVFQLQVQRIQQFVMIDMTANAFLHHMVRNIVGVLLRVGSGKLSNQEVKHILHLKNRRFAYETASPNGLYLRQVDYSDPYIFPKIASPSFLF